MRPLRYTLLVLLGTGAPAAWLLATDHVARSVGCLALGLLATLLLGFGWALRRRGRRMMRLALLLLGGTLFVGAFRLLVRYEGSADGTALPRLAWSWQARPPAPDMSAFPEQQAADPGPPPAGMADMKRFLGPAGDAVLPAPTWRADWAAHPPREVWRRGVGPGWSGIVVAGRRAVTQEQHGAQEWVTCYDAATGAPLWRFADAARFSEPLGGEGPRATPAIDEAGQRVFACGATGRLHCLDLSSGRPIWSRDILAETGADNLTYGKSSSPLLHDGRVIVTGGAGGPALLAYAQGDGRPLWRSGDESSSYSTPALRRLAGRDQIVSVNAGSVTGHDPATGQRLWGHPWPGDYPRAGQPAPAGTNRLLVTASYGQKSRLLEINADGDGLACRALWVSSVPRTKFSSATVRGDRAWALDEGTLVAVDLRNGERLWRRGHHGYGQHLQLGELLLIQAETGKVELIRPKEDGPESLGSLAALTSKTWNPPCLAGRWLLVRNDREMVCYELTE